MNALALTLAMLLTPVEHCGEPPYVVQMRCMDCNPYHVECLRCGLQAPAARHEAHAILLWNSMR